MSDPHSKDIRCPGCGRFIFRIVVTASEPVRGKFGEIQNVKCNGCGKHSNIHLGVFEQEKDKDVR